MNQENPQNPPQQKRFITIIGQDAHMKGEMLVDENTRILGRFEGSIIAKSSLHISESAQCNAQVDAAELILDGKVEGDISATNRIQINASAIVVGDIMAPKLMVEEGATIKGNVSIGIPPEPTYADEEVNSYQAPVDDLNISTGPSSYE